MKTFTVTIHNTTNYGAVLQAYALQQMIRSTGAENELFDYITEEDICHNLNMTDMMHNPVAYAKKIACAMLGRLNQKAIRKRKDAFKRFHDKHLILSQTYTSMEELKQNPPQADIYFAGSDQIWRFPEKERFIEARFLNFGSDSVKRYGYAASIEKLSYTDEQTELVKQWLSRFDGISLREQAAADFIHSITGYETTRVLDPVFLLSQEQWMQIAEKRCFREPYILCYQVQSAPCMQKIVNHLKKITGYKTVAVLPYSVKWIKTDVALFDVSPEEFIYLISHAEIVVAASFHGAALGIEFGKPVYSTARNSYNNRIKEIMTLFGIEDFFIDDESKIPEPYKYDVAYVNMKLDDERKRSREFLYNCLTKTL